MLRRLTFLLLLMLLATTSGCRKDFKKVADKMVEDDILKGRTPVTAIPFFEQGGRYYDEELDEEQSDQSQAINVDRDIVLPMLKRLLETTRTEQWVVPDTNDSQRAFALLVALPSNKQTENAMAKVIEEFDAKYDGLILQQWGHKWLSIDFLDKDSVEFFKKTDPNIEKQR
jgi:hypothetical protein